MFYAYQTWKTSGHLLPPTPKKLENTSFLGKNLEIFFPLFPGFKKVFSYHHAKMLGYYFSLFS